MLIERAEENEIKRDAYVDTSLKVKVGNDNVRKYVSMVKFYKARSRDYSIIKLCYGYVISYRRLIIRTCEYILSDGDVTR